MKKKELSAYRFSSPYDLADRYHKHGRPNKKEPLETFFHNLRIRSEKNKKANMTEERFRHKYTSNDSVRINSTTPNHEPL